MGGVFFLTCLSQPQFCIHVIKHLHCELEPAGEKWIPLLDIKEAPAQKQRWCDGVKWKEQQGCSVYFITKLGGCTRAHGLLGLKASKENLKKKICSIWKLTHYLCLFLQCAPGLHLWPPGSVGFLNAALGHIFAAELVPIHSVNSWITHYMHLGNTHIWSDIWQRVPLTFAWNSILVQSSLVYRATSCPYLSWRLPWKRRKETKIPISSVWLSWSFLVHVSTAFKKE